MGQVLSGHEANRNFLFLLYQFIVYVWLAVDFFS